MVKNGRLPRPHIGVPCGRGDGVVDDGKRPFAKRNNQQSTKNSQLKTRGQQNPCGFKQLMQNHHPI